MNLRGVPHLTVAACLIASAPCRLAAESALTVLGKGYTFPHQVDGLPSKLSDFPGLQINSFLTSDGLKLTYWEAGEGKSLIFVPGWSASGAQYINLMFLLRKQYHVFVLDPRNQELSQRVDYGNRMARFALDLKEFTEHLGLRSAYFCGHSMGSAILWSFIEQYGTNAIEKAIFVDQPISVTARPDWSDKERQDYGAMVDEPEELVRMMKQFLYPQVLLPISPMVHNLPSSARAPLHLKTQRASQKAPSAMIRTPCSRSYTIKQQTIGAMSFATKSTCPWPSSAVDQKPKN